MRIRTSRFHSSVYLILSFRFVEIKSPNYSKQKWRFTAFFRNSPSNQKWLHAERLIDASSQAISPRD